MTVLTRGLGAGPDAEKDGLVSVCGQAGLKKDLHACNSLSQEMEPALQLFAGM